MVRRLLGEVIDRADEAVTRARRGIAHFERCDSRVSVLARKVSKAF